MSKSIALENNNYWDSTSVMHKRQQLSEKLNLLDNNKVNGEICNWDKTITFSLTSGHQALILVGASLIILVWHGGSSSTAGYHYTTIFTDNTYTYTVVTGDNQITLNLNNNATVAVFKS